MPSTAGQSGSAALSTWLLLRPRLCTASAAILPGRGLVQGRVRRGDAAPVAALGLDSRCRVRHQHSDAHGQERAYEHREPGQVRVAVRRGASAPPRANRPGTEALTAAVPFRSMDGAVITGAFTLGGVVVGGALDWARASIAGRRAAAEADPASRSPAQCGDARFRRRRGHEGSSGPDAPQLHRDHGRHVHVDPPRGRLRAGRSDGRDGPAEGGPRNCRAPFGLPGPHRY
jgi:hypothetical protein